MIADMAMGGCRANSVVTCIGGMYSLSWLGVAYPIGRFLGINLLDPHRVLALEVNEPGPVAWWWFADAFSVASALSPWCS